MIETPNPVFRIQYSPVEAVLRAKIEYVRFHALS